MDYKQLKDVVRPEQFASTEVELMISKQSEIFLHYILRLFTACKLLPNHAASHRLWT